MDILLKIRPMLLNLEVGGVAIFPIQRLRSVRAQASELGAINNRIYKTHMDKTTRVITVVRTK